MSGDSAAESEGAFPDAFPISDDGETLALEKVLTGRGFVTGKSGSGKSNTASVVAEELLSLGLPMLVVDTDGEYVGLGETFDALHAGGDDRCDVQVSAADAERLATLALDRNVPVILDISGFLDAEEAADLVAAVVRELFQREATRRTPFLLVVEEIHEFLPQTGGLDDLGKLLVQVVKRGRKRGLGVLGLSQRPAAVDKEFITQCDWFVWHRLTWESDVDVAERFLGDEADRIADLGAGEAFVVTDWDAQVRRVQFRRKRTADVGATPTLDDLDRPRPRGSRDDVESALTGDTAGEDPSADATGDPGGDDADGASGETDEDSGTDDSSRSLPTVDPVELGPDASLLEEAAALTAYVVARVLDRSRRALSAVGRRAGR
ncbi:MAG: ATP-binding protein [Halobacteriaceae archaeon]